jgi:tetratricopeptide (TPR) repeat protein
VTRAQLRALLWGDHVFVDFENGLNVAVKKLRAALSDSADEPAYIETVAGEGYRFVGAVEKIAHPVLVTAPTPRELIPDSTVPNNLVNPPALPGFVSTAASGSRWRIGRWAAVAAALVVVVAGVSAFLPRPEAVSPPGNTTVLVGAFENATGEAVLDGTLQFALERELTNSRFVRVVSPERVQDILKLMRRPPDARLDRPLALNICRRTPDIRTLVTGRVAKIGSQYLLTANVVDPTTGNILHAAEARASKPDDILAALHRLSGQVRHDVGESMPAGPPLAPAPEPVTTSSLRALQLYSEANDFMIRHGPQGEDIAALLEQALAADPDFASAHIMLGYVLGNMGRPGGDQQFERAFALADTTSERERLFILGSYYGAKSSHPGDEAWTKAIAAYEQLVRHYPDDHWGLNNLHFFYDAEGRTRESLQLRVRKLDLRPENEDAALGDLWGRLISFGDVATANRFAARCDHEPAFKPCQRLFVQRDAQPIWRELRQGRPEEALRIAEQLARKYSRLDPAIGEELSLALNGLYTSAGMLQADAALAASLPGADWQFGQPVLIAHYREDRRALSAALTKLLKRHDTDTNGSGMVLFLTQVGRLREARAMLAVLEKTAPLDVVQIARGYLKFAEGDPWGSILDLRAGATGFSNRHSDAFILVCDRLAIALESVGQTGEAVQTLADCETQLLARSDLEFVGHWNSTARWHLAVLYRQTGQVEKAEAIEDALRGQLKLADSDHPIARALKQLGSSNYQAANRN